MKRMASGLFITGTDTGVGKTYVSAGIATALKCQGVDVGVMKPAETGCKMREGLLMPRDALRLIKAAGVNDSLSLVTPYMFRRPLAPAVAGELEGRMIDPVRIISAFQTLSKRHEFMIVEGAGGIMVPLFGKYTYLDLAKKIGLPVLIVARPGIGTINHTMLTIAALKGHKIDIAGIVINYALEQKKGSAEKTSPAAIEKMSNVRIMGIIPYGSRTFDDLLNEILRKGSLRYSCRL
jgi:dethiobiotin synthetase